MENNWQVFDMWRNLSEVMLSCGGDREEVSPKKLSKMTALELMELLAPNDVRFCIKEKDVQAPLDMSNLKPFIREPVNLHDEGTNKLTIEHRPEQASFMLGSPYNNIEIRYDEMKRLVAFVKGESN